MDMDDSLYLPKEHNLAMLAMFATHFGSWRDSWSAVVQYKSRSAMHSYSWYLKLRTGRLQVIDLFRFVFVYPSQTAWYSQGKKSIQIHATNWKFLKTMITEGELEWWNGTRLPPIWPGFAPRTRRHINVEFVLFPPGSPLFLPPQKPTLLNSNSISYTYTL